MKLPENRFKLALAEGRQQIGYGAPVRFYTRLKTITSRWPTGIRSGADFVMPTMR
jgi:hypothetical protein